MARRQPSPTTDDASAPTPQCRRARLLAISHRRRITEEVTQGASLAQALVAVGCEWRDFAHTLVKREAFRDEIRNTLLAAAEVRQWAMEDALYRGALAAATDPRFQTTAIWCSKALCGFGEHGEAALRSLPGDNYRDEFGGELAQAL